MTTPQLMVVIDGEIRPIADTFWVRADAGGCAYGSIHGDMAMTAEQAHREFKPRQRDRDRDNRQGYTVQLITREQWKADVEPCFLGTCEHRRERGGSRG